MVSFVTASESSEGDLMFVWVICGGRRAREREKSGDGKTVRALTRMFVIVSSRVSWGLNWYLADHILVSNFTRDRFDAEDKEVCSFFLSDRANIR